MQDAPVIPYYSLLVYYIYIYVIMLCLLQCYKIISVYIYVENNGIISLSECSYWLAKGGCAVGIIGL